MWWGRELLAPQRGPRKAGPYACRCWCLTPGLLRPLSPPPGPGMAGHGTFLPGVRPSPRIPRQASADSGPALLDLTVEPRSQGTPGSLQLAPGPRGTVEGHTTPLLPPTQNSCISQGHSPLESLLSSGLPPCCSSLPAPGVWGLGSGLAHTEA